MSVFVFLPSAHVETNSHTHTVTCIINIEKHLNPINTQKSSEIPMGGGKGPVDHYVAVIRPGTILFELAGMTEAKARQAIKAASYKLPIKTSLVERRSI